MPCRQGLFSEPNCDAAAPQQRGIVFRPVRYPVSGLGKLVAATFGELVRHGFPQPPAWDRWAYPTVRPPASLPIEALANYVQGRILGRGRATFCNPRSIHAQTRSASTFS